MEQRPSVTSRAKASVKRVFQHLKDQRAAGSRGRSSTCDKSAPVEELPALLRLPAELRQIIWRYALTNDCKPHFHIYSDIYTTCTYITPPPVPRPTSALKHISLLLTSRAIHDEAVQHLWDRARFDLVLLPGLARPRRTAKACTTLGAVTTPRNAALLHRMRRVRVVVQPGRQPDADRFAARIAAFWAALDHGRRARELAVTFNFHDAMLDRQLAAKVVEAVFAGLAADDACEEEEEVLVGKTGKREVQRRRKRPVAVHLLGLPLDVDFAAAIAVKVGEMRKALTGEKREMGRIDGGKKVHREKCATRGFLGDLPPGWQNSSQPTRWESAGLVAFASVTVLVLVITLPVSVPTITYFVRDRKNQKGEK